MNVKDRVQVIQQDITTMVVDAIVNAANTSLLGGGGVDGAIHRAAGPDLVMECRMLHGCKTGQAKITKGYRLPAGHVIHTVGPVWNGGFNDEEGQLASCYRNSLAIAEEKGFVSIAFPSISTGVYRFPVEKAARIAMTTVKEHLVQYDNLKQVSHVCFSAGDLAIYKEAFTKVYGA